MHQIVAVTPAGRQGYLELLSHYVLQDASISEWHLWDNCRLQSDREYINNLAAANKKVRVIRAPKADGFNSSVNQFYSFCNDANAFYIKMDDDLVYLSDQLGAKLYKVATENRKDYIWWSPMVINNAICSWLWKYIGEIDIKQDLTAQAACRVGWRSATFAEHIHRIFLAAAKGSNLESFVVPDQNVSLSRFSINCIGFFGEDVATMGTQFCPLGVDDEEWISAVLPAKTARLGRIAGQCLVSHFSYFPQEVELLKTNLLEEYYKLVGKQVENKPVRKQKLKTTVKLRALDRLLGPQIRL